MAKVIASKCCSGANYDDREAARSSRRQRRHHPASILALANDVLE
jgi:hypothetical protein